MKVLLVTIVLLSGAALYATAGDPVQAPADTLRRVTITSGDTLSAYPGDSIDATWTAGEARFRLIAVLPRDFPPARYWLHLHGPTLITQTPWRIVVRVVPRP